MRMRYIAKPKFPRTERGFKGAKNMVSKPAGRGGPPGPPGRALGKRGSKRKLGGGASGEAGSKFPEPARGLRSRASIGGRRGGKRAPELSRMNGRGGRGPPGPALRVARVEGKTAAVTVREIMVASRAATTWMGTLRRRRPRSSGKRRESQKMTGVSATHGIQFTAEMPRASAHSKGPTRWSNAAKANVSAVQTAACAANSASGRRTRLGGKADTDSGEDIDADGASTWRVKPVGAVRSRLGWRRRGETERARTRTRTRTGETQRLRKSSQTLRVFLSQH